MKIGKIEINKKLFITFIVVLVLAIAAFIINELYIKRYEKYKITKEEDFIYTKINYETADTHIPYVNIDSDNAKEVNEKLKTMALIYTNGFHDNISLTYEYNVSDNYVSLVLLVRNFQETKHTNDYITYVFDLNNNGKLITNDDILKLFNKTENDVNNKIESEMTRKYNYEIEQNILPSTCDYSCFLKLRNIESYIDNITYHIENGNLVAYRPYNVYSEYNEEAYYTRDDFKFYIN